MDLLKNKHFFIVMAAYNEERTIARSVDSVFQAVLFIKKLNPETSCDLVICHNGCSDKTPAIAHNLKNKYSNSFFKVHVISSAKGAVIAQSSSVEYIRKQKEGLDSPIVFVDADSFVEKNTIYALLEQFKKHSKLKASGARTIPIPYSGLSPIKRIWDKVFNCRAYFPRSEISIKFAPQFHPYANSDPQPGYEDFENRSKTYFHGRCFALKDQSIWDVPESRVGEDTYLDRSINYRFGPGSIRVMFNAKIYYEPVVSMRVFVRTFYRIYYDLRSLKESYPQFNEVREYSKTKLDWEYINSLPLKWRAVFKIYNAIRQTFRFLFRYKLIYARKPVMVVWSYDKK